MKKYLYLFLNQYIYPIISFLYIQLFFVNFDVGLEIGDFLNYFDHFNIDLLAKTFIPLILYICLIYIFTISINNNFDNFKFNKNYILSFPLYLLYIMLNFNIKYLIIINLKNKILFTIWGIFLDILSNLNLCIFISLLIIIFNKIRIKDFINIIKLKIKIRYINYLIILNIILEIIEMFIFSYAHIVIPEPIISIPYFLLIIYIFSDSNKNTDLEVINKVLKEYIKWILKCSLSIFLYLFFWVYSVSKKINQQYKINKHRPIASSIKLLIPGYIFIWLYTQNIKINKFDILNKGFYIGMFLPVFASLVFHTFYINYFAFIVISYLLLLLISSFRLIKNLIRYHR